MNFHKLVVTCVFVLINFRFAANAAIICDRLPIGDWKIMSPIPTELLKSTSNKDVYGALSDQLYDQPSITGWTGVEFFFVNRGPNETIWHYDPCTDKWRIPVFDQTKINEGSKHWLTFNTSVDQAWLIGVLNLNNKSKEEISEPDVLIAVKYGTESQKWQLVASEVAQCQKHLSNKSYFICVTSDRRRLFFRYGSPPQFETLDSIPQGSHVCSFQLGEILYEVTQRTVFQMKVNSGKAKKKWKGLYHFGNPIYNCNWTQLSPNKVLFWSLGKQGALSAIILFENDQFRSLPVPRAKNTVALHPYSDLQTAFIGIWSGTEYDQFVYWNEIKNRWDKLILPSIQSEKRSVAQWAFKSGTKNEYHVSFFKADQLKTKMAYHLEQVYPKIVWSLPRQIKTSESPFDPEQYAPIRVGEFKPAPDPGLFVFGGPYVVSFGKIEYKTGNSCDDPFALPELRNPNQPVCTPANGVITYSRVIPGGWVIRAK